MEEVDNEVRWDKLATLINDFFNSSPVNLTEMAETLGVDRRTIYRWWAGTHRPKGEFCTPLAEYIGVHPDVVLEAAGYRPSIQAAEQIQIPKEFSVYFDKFGELDEQTRNVILRYLSEKIDEAAVRPKFARPIQKEEN